MCVQSLRDEGYDVTGYFANPNIHPVSEYFRRREAMEQVAEQMDLPMLWQDDAYDLPGWLKMVHDLALRITRDMPLRLLLREPSCPDLRHRLGERF